MQKTIEICIARDDQRAEVLALIMSAYAEYEQQSDKAFWSQYEKSIEKAVLADSSITPIIAISDSKILGAVLFCDPYEKKMGDAVVKNPYPEMRLLAVPPQNRDHGIGQKLIAFCENKAISSGFKTMTLHTTVLMQTAKAMYERRGYVKYPEIDFEPIPGFQVWGYRKNFIV